MSWFVVLLAASAPSLTQEPPRAEESKAAAGFVFCSNQETQAVPTYGSLCSRFSAGNLACGQKVEVRRRQGDFLEIALEDRVSRYVLASFISQNSDSFVGFGRESGIPEAPAGDCKPSKDEVRAPKAIYQPDPDYTDEARKKKIQGEVELSLTVGIDGRSHDVKVTKKLGHGLDENAVECVKHWKFTPATRNGQPVAVPIYVSVSFRLY